MKLSSLFSQSARNALRSKSRTTLTVIAIFIGAFTLTITSGIGTGVNNYIDMSIASIGAQDTLTITKPTETTAVEENEGPQEYSEDQILAEQNAPGPGNDTVTLVALTQTDLSELGEIEYVLDVQPTKQVSAEYIQGLTDERFVVSLGAFVEGMQLTLATGAQLDDTTEAYEIAVPESYLEALGFESQEAAIGETVSIGFNDFDGEIAVIEAEVVAVTLPGFGPGADNAVPNRAFKNALYELESDPALAAEEREYQSATLWFDLDNMTAAQIEGLEAELDEMGFNSTSTEESLGTFTAIIDVAVLVLNVFAIIALFAAGFGIVNTLFMSVQERTREIGLMKAMGLASNRVFALFSFEAIVIGLLGSLLGVGAGMGIGTLVSDSLSRSIFSDLAGFQLVAFDPIAVASVIGIVLAISFIAGTFPALKAARKDPIDALRYE